MLPGKKFYVEYGVKDYREKLAGLDKSQSYYVYCHSGLRSARTAFNYVYNVEGGIVEWKKNGDKIE